LKNYTPLLIFEELWRELELLKIHLCWDICPLAFIFLLLSFFFFSLSFFLNRAPKSLLEILMEVVTKGYLELYWITKGLAMNEGKFLMLTPSVGVEQLWDVSKWKVCGCVLPG
jgi:hypothetical protein